MSSRHKTPLEYTCGGTTVLEYVETMKPHEVTFTFRRQRIPYEINQRIVSPIQDDNGLKYEMAGPHFGRVIRIAQEFHKFQAAEDPPTWQVKIRFFRDVDTPAPVTAG